MSHNNNDNVIFKATDLLPVIQEAIVHQCSLLLVKDHGLYIMSEKGPLDPVTKRRQVAYAEGFNPDVAEFDDWYDRLHDICGGDDFTEIFSPEDSMMQAVIKHNINIRISFTERSFSIIPDGL